ncbi:MAG: sulfatase [Myxococcota bacterium]
MSGRKVLYAVLGLILVALFFITQFRLQPDERPVGDVENILELARRDDLNIVFVLIDTLRADRLSSYGYERPTSPTMDRLASTGIRFSHHYSQSSWTKTSMAAIWTGMYPHRNGILRFDHALPKAALLPAEILKEEGFSTAAIWRNGWVAPTFGFDQGFETYHRPGTGMQLGFNRRDSKNPYAKIAGSDVDVTDNAIEFLRLAGEQPFMLYLHYMDAHQYMSDETSALFGSSYSDLYDNSIHWTDRNIAALINTLEEEGLRDNTLVVITSDHGEAFGEHGAEGHAKDLHAEVIRVPWILSLPFSLAEGIVVDALSENVDIWPTLFDLLGAPELEYADGRSRLPEILTSAGRADLIEREPDAGPLFAELDRAWGKAEKRPDAIVALTLPEQRYLRVLDPKAIKKAPGQSGPEKSTALLYDLYKDPMEQTDLLEFAENDDSAAKLDAIVDEILSRPPPPWRDDVGRVELSDMQKGQLRAIGYAIE